MKTKTDEYVIEISKKWMGTYVELRKGEEVLDSGIITIDASDVVMKWTIKYGLPNNTKVVYT